ncbi:MAG: hypothetical protein LBC07_06370 [Elusimicrobiota bacterium]|jgi:hypothetical protein|nr:hypothetical protein [Elusimicrobiota bacterium]
MKKTVFFSLCLGFLIFTACSKLDVVGDGAEKSFARLLDLYPQLVSMDDHQNGWAFSSPDASAKFIWSKNWAESPFYDVAIELDAKPFIAAGLDVKKLPAEYFYYNGKILIGTKLGTQNIKYKGAPTPLASFEEIVKLSRANIGYDEALEHYGVDLGAGNLFEWAKDSGANDKDILFVLDPDPFLDAGVDPTNIDGWAFARVVIEDEDGRTIEVEKILKAVNLNS